MTMYDEDRLVAGSSQERGDNALRPTLLAEFIGQGNGRRNLETFIHAARNRGDAMDHTLLHGPPGLGKTTLAQIIAAELGVGFRATSGPVVARAGDLAALHQSSNQVENLPLLDTALLRPLEQDDEFHQ